MDSVTRQDWANLAKGLMMGYTASTSSTCLGFRLGLTQIETTSLCIGKRLESRPPGISARQRNLDVIVDNRTFQG